MVFTEPTAAIFFNCSLFNHSPTKLIVACFHDIFIVDMSTQSTQPFSSTLQDAFYRSHALALSDDDALLVAGSYLTDTVCGYDTASRIRLWIHNPANSVDAVCILGAHVLVTVFCSQTLVLNCKTGELMARLQKTDACIYGLGVIEGLCFILSC